MAVAGTETVGVVGAAVTVDVGWAVLALLASADDVGRTDGGWATDAPVRAVVPAPGVAVSWPDVAPEQAASASSKEGANGRSALTSGRTAGGSAP